MKKIILGLAFCLLAYFGQAQNGLEGIIVEKYYISNAADAAGSAGVLPEGSVTYRIWVDMLPGYKFKMAYGNTANALKLTTTTTFFNNEDYGSTTPGFSANNSRKNTVMLDSWLSVGAVHAGKLGVMKSEDDNVAGTNPPYVNTNGLLANTDAAMGFPLTTQDGVYSGSTAPEDVTLVGISGAELGLFNDGSANGSSFITTGGAWSSFNGSVGATASNKVLIAQITTDGVFHYELNIQLQDAGGNAEKYVVANPQGTERNIPSLVGTYSGVNQKPVVSITAPVNGAFSVTGDAVTISADATDTDGTISKVEFKIDGTLVNTDTEAPYTFNYTGVAGVHNITAVATDNESGFTTSVAVELTVGPDPAPTVSITAPAANATPKVGSTVAITATANDNVSVTQVEFFVDDVSLSVDNSSPYEASYTAAVLGNHTITAKATDNRSQIGTSTGVSITVIANTPPTVSITAPANGANVMMNTTVALTATAGDTDGTVASVEFFVDNVSVGSDNSDPYSVNWTPSVEKDGVVIKAVATDNSGAVNAVPQTVTVNVNDPNGLPYVIGEVTQVCNLPSVCIPVSSTKTTMSGVIGYDIELKYDATKVVPTGTVTLNNALLSAGETASVVTNIDAANSVLNITITLNGTAPGLTDFQGAGQLFCAEFTKLPAFQPEDNAVFSAKSFVESSYFATIDKSVKPGKLITYKDDIFNGSLKFWKDNSAIAYNAASPNDHLVTNIYGYGLTTNPVTPDVNGIFEYDVDNGKTISIERDILNTTDVQSVIMSADALEAARIANKNTTNIPTVFSIIASDVNLDGKVSAGDATLINWRSVGKLVEFPQAWNVLATKISKDWLFVNSATLTTAPYLISVNYPNDDPTGFSKNRVPSVNFEQPLPAADWAGCPLILDDVFTGIMLGDVNGSYATIPNSGLLKSGKISEELVILDFSKAVDVNNVVTVPVSVTTTLEELYAIDLGIIINDEKIEKIELVQNSNFANLDLGYNTGTKKLKIAGYSFNDIPRNNSFSLKITKRNSDALVAADFDAVQVNLTNNPMTSVIDGTLKVIDQLTTGISDFSSNIRVYPNPAKNLLNVEVVEDSDVRIFDINGRLVIETTLKVGEKAIDVQNLTNGVYMMKVYNTNNGTPFMHKVIIQK